MTRIAICTPCVEHGDAVSNDVIGMYHILSKRGFQVSIFSDLPIKSRHEQRDIKSLKKFITHSDDILIYHHSVGWESGIRFLRKINCKKVIKYHNITPAKFFKKLSNDHYAVCSLGRQQLNCLVDIDIDLYLADSEYNSNELVEIGDGKIDCLVIPPFHNIDRLQQLKASNKEIQRFGDHITNILMVGRIVPNKGLHHLIDTFAIYHNEFNDRSRLLIIGKQDPRMASYATFLANKIKALGLHKLVLLLGHVTDKALKAYYQIADVFMTTSVHEGFCVPLVEAMSMKVPIVAYASCAIPYTVGKAGIVWDEFDPRLLAASVNRIVTNQTLRDYLSQMGRLRYKEEFTNEKIGKLLLKTLTNYDLLPSCS